ncbi:MAG TPA: hypothetical protein VH539_23465 [Gemmatimonadaceae bacterium]|jgi:hypothetical protein
MSTPQLDPTRQAPASQPYTDALPRRTTPVRPPGESPSPTARTWSTGRRIGFRFVFAYLVLYNLPFPIGTIPYTSAIQGWYQAIWNALVPWFGAHVLHLAKPITIFPSGSGDKTYDYVQLLLFLIVASAITVVWSLLDRRRAAYPRLAYWLRVYVRYSLGFILLGYGGFKVIKSQFPDVSLGKLVEPFGDFSPMGVIWSWMGVSYAYNIFAGLAEMGSGFLLFFRRTVSLGAFCGVAVLANVVMINFAYDVPVKLYSSHLLLMAIFLLASDLKRLVGAFVLNRPVPPADLGPAWPAGGRRIALGVAKASFVALGVLSPLWASWQQSRLFGSAARRPPLYGIWEVDSFVRGHDAIPALVGDSVRWRRMVVNYPGFLSVRLLNDSTRGYRVQADSVRHTLVLSTMADSSKKFPFSYTRAGLFNEQLQLDGTFGGDSLHLRLHRVDENRFLLLSRGYHWINELPFNR